MLFRQFLVRCILALQMVKRETRKSLLTQGALSKSTRAGEAQGSHRGPPLEMSLKYRGVSPRRGTRSREERRGDVRSNARDATLAKWVEGASPTRGRCYLFAPVIDRVLSPPDLSSEVKFITHKHIHELAPTKQFPA